MATISRDDLHLCISKSIQFSRNSAWTFIKHHPFISFTFFFFSFLYAFSPFFFWALIHFLAFLILLISITMLFSNPNPNSNYNYNPPECKINNADPIKNRNGRPFVRARSVRQRKSRDASRTSSVQSSEEDEKNMVISSNMVDKNPKEIREVPEEIHGNNIETESSEDDDEKNKGGVQWTEDDEKNLTDLGLSEMERNKRLESLIARRRARKMFSLQIRKTLLLNKEISLIIQPPPPPPPPIAILKNNKPFSSHGGGSASGEVSPTPGSAPPVLLPAHDPFDLPYDPFEEKPVLTGGSFHQEFIAPEPLDAVFCRHESFCLGKQDEHTGHQNTEVLDNCNQLEEKDIDKIIKEVESSSCQSPESNFKKIKADHCITEEIQGSEKGTVMVDDDIPEENRTTEEVETKSMVVENPSYCRSSSTSSEEDEPPFIRVDKEAILKSLASPHPRSFSLNRDHTSNQMGHILNNYDAAMMDKVIRHRPTHSIASDMQVEVSEIGSPPQTIDGSFSSFDIGSPIEEEDINYGNESLWELSSQISVNDEDKSALKEIYRLHDEYTIKHGTSRCKQSKDSVELRDLVQNMEEQGVSGSFTRPDDSQISTPESSQTFIPGISDHSDVENAEKLTETGTVRHFDSDCDEILEESSHLSTSSMEANLFPSSTEPNVTEYENRQKDTLEVPQNTSTSIISHFDTITDLQKPMEESNPSFSDEINNKSEDSVDLANIGEQFDQSNRLPVDTEEPSYPSTSSMEAKFFTTRTDSEFDEHEDRQNEPMEVTQSTSTRITNLEQPSEEYESSSLDEANNKSEDPQKHLSPPKASANSEEQVDTKTESSIAIDERQNVTMEDPKNASSSSSSTSPITKESDPSTLDNKDDKKQSPHKHEVN